MNGTAESAVRAVTLDSALLDSLLDVFRCMIEVGAEIYRVEESAEHVSLAYGATRVEAYATTGQIIVSVETADGITLTDTRRIRSLRTDMEQLDKLNSLVRHICEELPSCREIKEAVAEIAKTPLYRLPTFIIANGIVAAAFCLFFGGRTIGEFFCAFFIGLSVGALTKLAEKTVGNKFMQRFLCSLLNAALAFTCLRLSLIPTVDYVIIGNIMLLIPGVGLTNAIRDLFVGDSITGVLRAIEALLLALAIAAGYILASYLFGGAV